MLFTTTMLCVMGFPDWTVIRQYTIAINRYDGFHAVLYTSLV
jgi:hypothetical protein